ncbi:hypothetical protein WME94_18090 [Sorangium sp. So ce429]
MRGHVSKVLRLAVVAFACAMMAASGGPLRYTPQGIGKAPGADAVIVADVNFDAAMTRLDINTKNLPPPDRLDSSSTAFVVWARANSDSPWQRVGALDYDVDGRTRPPGSWWMALRTAPPAPRREPCAGRGRVA